jgi:hypothetical protein
MGSTDDWDVFGRIKNLVLAENRPSGRSVRSLIVVLQTVLARFQIINIIYVLLTVLPSYVLLTVLPSRYNSCKWPTWRTILFFYMFISILYMYRATSSSSSGESIVSIQHLVCVTVSLWPSSMQFRKFLPDLHTRRSPKQSDTYQMLYWYNWFSWWWARGCSKHCRELK